MEGRTERPRSDLLKQHREVPGVEFCGTVVGSYALGRFGGLEMLCSLFLGQDGVALSLALRPREAGYHKAIGGLNSVSCLMWVVKALSRSTESSIRGNQGSTQVARVQQRQELL